MNGLVFDKPFRINFETLPEPEIETPDDVIVEVLQTALCGSDLHPYRGLEEGLDPGTVMGHEMVGRILEVGANVLEFGAGDKVCVPFTTSCGSCKFCLSGMTCRCRQGQLLGWRSKGAGLHGTQAERVRVPLADSTLLALPAELSTETGLLVGDNLATGYFAALQAEVGPGRSCVVVGCGTVGLLAILSARELGCETVFAIDPLPERRMRAEQFGALALPPGDASQLIHSRTDGLGVDCVIEAVGNLAAQRTAFETLKPGGILSTVGVHTGSKFAFTPVELYDRNLTFKVGRCPARALASRVLPIALARDQELAALFTHRLPLRQGVEAYEMFESRSDGCLKVLLEP